MSVGSVSPSGELLMLVWPAAVQLPAIRAAAAFGLADQIGTGPKTLAELASATNTHAPSLGRLLRALTTIGVFREDAGRFHQTPLSDTLRADHPQSTRGRVLMLGAEFVWRPAGNLERAVRTGHAAFDDEFGGAFFEYLAQHPDDAAMFAAGVNPRGSHVPEVLAAYDFSRFEHVIDVGGGRGALLAGILTAHPSARGVLYDLPFVVQSVVPACGALGERLEVVAGDFFTEVPCGGDLYILSHVLHDWNDDQGVRILGMCRRAMRNGGSILVLETIVPSVRQPQRAFMDLLMMALTGGRERTQAEFEALFHAAGLTMRRAKPTRWGTLMEAVPVGE